MSLIASSAPIPKDSATFPAMKSWRGSAIAVVDPYVGDRESRNGCRAPFSAQFAGSDQPTLPPPHAVRPPRPNLFARRYS